MGGGLGTEKHRAGAYWFIQREFGGFPVEKAALGSCDLSVLHVGGNWEWLVRQAGRDVAEGTARGAIEAKQEAERVALLNADC